MGQERRKALGGRPPSAPSKMLHPDVFNWAEELQDLRREGGKLHGVTFQVLEQDLGAGVSTLARYFAGTRIPEITFLDRLCKSIEKRTRRPVNDKYRERLKNLYFAAVRHKDPVRANVYALEEQLTSARQAAERAQDTVLVLRAQIRSERVRRHMPFELPSSSSDPRIPDRPAALSAIEETVQRAVEAGAQLNELDDLFALRVQQLLTTLHELRRIETARDAIAGELSEAERVLNAHLEREWAQESPESPESPDGQRKRWLRRHRGENTEEPVTQRPDPEQLLSLLAALSSRQQPLYGRQLALLGDSPAAQLTREARRRGEALLALLGASPPRLWEAPLHLAKVLEEAAGEIEQSERVHVAPLQEKAAVGVVPHVVTDVCHLLAELLENATNFSSPHTGVEVSVTKVDPTGIALAVDDIGVGVPEDQLAAINEQLRNPPETAARRLGIFLVARLAQQHGIRVELTPRPSGGTRAHIHLPMDLLA